MGAFVGGAIVMALGMIISALSLTLPWYEETYSTSQEATPGGATGTGVTTFSLWALCDSGTSHSGWTGPTSSYGSCNLGSALPATEALYRQALILLVSGLVIGGIAITLGLVLTLRNGLPTTWTTALLVALTGLSVALLALAPAIVMMHQSAALRSDPGCDAVCSMGPAQSFSAGQGSASGVRWQASAVWGPGDGWVAATAGASVIAPGGVLLALSQRWSRRESMKDLAKEFT